MPVAAGDPLVGGEFVGTDRTAGMEAVGADANDGAQTIIAAAGKPGRGIDQHRGGIDPQHKGIGEIQPLRDNPVGVTRTMLVDVLDRRLDAIDYL